MKIDPTGPARTTTSVRRGERSSGTRGGDFARHLDAPTNSGGVSGGSPISTLNTMLSLQEVDDPLTGKRRAAQRAEEILDRLDELRVGLLAGSMSRHSLMELSALVRTHRPGISDPGLQDVLDEIQLRAEVELAKLDVSTRQT